MSHFQVRIPTFNGHFISDELEADQVREYGDPYVPVTVYKQAGIRVVLGTHNPEEDSHAPDLLIERQPHMWAVFIHPEGDDPSCYIYILDNGQTYIVPDAAVQIVKDPCQIPGHEPLPRGDENGKE